MEEKLIKEKQAQMKAEQKAKSRIKKEGKSLSSQKEEHSLGDIVPLLANLDNEPKEEKREVHTDEDIFNFEQQFLRDGDSNCWWGKFRGYSVYLDQYLVIE
jgi:hypothetical protein